MKKKQWFVQIFRDEEMYYEEVSTWFSGICKILEVIQKDLPFTCSIDFFYRDGDGK